MIALRLFIKNIKAIKKTYPNQIDEQNLLKAKTKTIVAKSRVDAVKQAINGLNQVVIFDDGLQEKKIDYDLKIVCFKKKNWIGNGQLIPSGPLREKIENLKNYDIVFLNGKDDFCAAPLLGSISRRCWNFVQKLFSHKPCF